MNSTASSVSAISVPMAASIKTWLARSTQWLERPAKPNDLRNVTVAARNGRIPTGSGRLLWMSQWPLAAGKRSLAGRWVRSPFVPPSQAHGQPRCRRIGQADGRDPAMNQPSVLPASKDAAKRAADSEAVSIFAVCFALLSF